MLQAFDHWVVIVRKKHFPDRREHILQAADRLFNLYGVEKTTVEDVSRESGVPRATIYLEFPSGKEAIMMACLDRYVQALLGELRELSRKSKVGRLETLKSLMLHYVLSTYDKSTQHKWESSTLEKSSTKIRNSLVDFREKRNELFAEVLNQAALAGEIPVEYDTRRLAELVAYGLNCFVPPVSLLMTRVDLERDATAFFSFLLSGLVKSQRKVAF